MTGSLWFGRFWGSKWLPQYHSLVDRLIQIPMIQQAPCFFVEKHGASASTSPKPGNWIDDLESWCNKRQDSHAQHHANMEDLEEPLDLIYSSGKVHGTVSTYWFLWALY